MKPGDVVEVNQRKYRALQDSDGNELCGGCAARDDNALCEALPDCVGLTDLGDTEDFGYIFVECWGE